MTIPFKIPAGAIKYAGAGLEENMWGGGYAEGPGPQKKKHSGGGIKNLNMRGEKKYQGRGWQNFPLCPSPTGS